ncbi:MAG TPA: type II secretion system protein PulP [Desulfuromonadales bacterium]|nr:type II secretion system protein PulP [Desulfuromonadales bacterium]
MNRQRLILFVLVLLFGVTVLWSYSTMPRLKTVGTSSGKPGQSAKTTAVAVVEKAVRVTDDGTKLNIGLLDEEVAAFKGYRRNIFKPIFVDELKMNKQNAVALKPPPPKIIPAPIPVPAPVQPVIIQPESVPLAHFTFLGFLKKGSVKTIFLSKDNNILLVKKGDKVAGRYQATDISDQALTLTVTDTGDEIVIPLIENRPLGTAK